MICQSHDAVLRHWLHAVETGRLPESGVSVVHFDGHPDLAVPEGLLLRVRSPAAGPLPGIDIASFQLAAVWMGLVDRVVWIRPPWARQLPDGPRSFHLGRLADGRLRVDDPSDYYVLDGGWAPSEELRDAVPLRLDVLPLGASLPSLPGPVVLDIDMDAWATRNPGADQLRSAGLGEDDLALLRRAFDRERLALPGDPQQRARALQEVLAATRAVVDGSLGEALRGALTLWRVGVPIGDLIRVARLLAREDVALPSQAWLESGRELVGLPEHAADPEEIRETTAALLDMLRRSGLEPRLVTLSRSVHDGFTPADAWPSIEWSLIRALGELLPEGRVRFDSGQRPAPRP